MQYINYCNVKLRTYKLLILNNLPRCLEEPYVYWNENDWLISYLVIQLNLPMNLKKNYFENEKRLNFSQNIRLSHLSVICILN